MQYDPLSSSNYLRITQKDEAIDGQGVRYRLERKHDCEIHPLFVIFSIVGLLVLLTSSSPIPEPESIDSDSGRIYQQNNW